MGTVKRALPGNTASCWQKALLASYWEKPYTYLLRKRFRNIWSKFVKAANLACKYLLSFLYTSLLLRQPSKKIPQPCDMTYNLQFMWPLPPSAPLAKLCDFHSLFFCFSSDGRNPPNASPLANSLWISQLFARARAHSLCDFVISFPALLSLRPLSLFGSRAKMGRQREKARPRTSSRAPAPAEEQGLLVGNAAQLSPSLAGEREGCGNSLLSRFLTPATA